MTRRSRLAALLSRPAMRVAAFGGAALIAAGLVAWRLRPPAGPEGIAGIEARIAKDPRAAGARLDLAAARAAAGDTIGAIEQLEAVRALGRGDERLALQLADLYRSIGLLDEAAGVLAAAASPSDELRLRLSQDRMSLGDFAGACEALEPFRARFPSIPVETAQRVARQLLLAGRWEEASALFPRETADTEWLALRGLHATLTGSHAAAIADLERAVSLAPADGWNRYLLAGAYRAAGRRKEAQAAFSEVSNLSEAPPRAHVGLARLLVEDGRWELADTALRRADNDAQQDPDYWRVRALVAEQAGKPVDAAFARGMAASTAGDPLGAEKEYREGAARGGRDAAAKEVWSALLLSAESRNDTAAALRYATEGTRLFPQEALFHRRAAELYLEGNRYAEAVAAAARLAKVSPPEEAAAVADLQARLALEAGRHQELERAARRGMMLDPGDANPYLLLAEWHAGRGEAERAREMYRQAATVDPENAEARARLGTQLVEAREYDSGVPMLRHALKLNPRILDGAPDVLLAQVYRRQGRVPEAEFHERRFRRLREQKDRWTNLLRVLRQPASAAEYRELGQAALESRVQQVALWAFSLGSRAAPEDPAMWRGLAAVYKRQGLFEEALAAMRRAHRLAPPSGGAG